MKKTIATLALLLMLRVFVNAGIPPAAPVAAKFYNTDYYQIYNSLLYLSPHYIPTRQSPTLYKFYNNDLFQIYNAQMHMDSIVHGLDSIIQGGGGGGGSDLADTLYIQTNGHGSTYQPANNMATNETWVGYLAGGGGASKTGTVDIGYNAGTGNQGDYGVNIGYQAGDGASFVTNGVCIGSYAGVGATGATHATFIGNAAGGDATNAVQGTFYGNQAGNQATNAARSEFMGYGAGQLATNAAQSIFIGWNAGLADAVNNTGGTHSILIGDSTSTGGFSSSAAIGTGAQNTAASQLAFSPYYTKLLLPLNGGASGNVLTTDGAGNASWQAAAGGSPTVNNGLTNNAGTVQLGGNLIHNTTISRHFTVDTMSLISSDTFLFYPGPNFAFKGLGFQDGRGMVDGIIDASPIGGSPSELVLGYPFLNQAIIINGASISANTTKFSLAGQLQYTNGTQAAGYFLQTDGSGNANWVAPPDTTHTYATQAYTQNLIQSSTTVAKSYIVLQTSSQSPVTYTPATAGYYEVGGDFTITVNGGATISLLVNYTDQAGGFAAFTLIPSEAAVNVYHASPVTIRSAAGAAITLTISVMGSGSTYYGGGYVKYISN